jgi:thymidylate synthase (FAD)
MKIIKPSFEILTNVDGQLMLQRIEYAGRICYKSESRVTFNSAWAFVQRIIKSGHESVIEHESVTVRIICDRGVSHEIVRHRLASYSQESTRYCNYGKTGEIVLSPMMWGLTDAQILRRKALYQNIEEVYLAEVSEGVSPQQARDNLPTCLKTEIVMTCNLREWRHFFKLRTAPAAHPQMREITIPMLVEFKRLIPIVFDDIAPKES